MLAAFLLTVVVGCNIVPSTIMASAQEQDFSEKSVEVQAGNKTYPLFYYMSSGGTINSVSTDTYLIMAINVTSLTDGKLELRFPRELYDALSFTEHDEPILFVNEVPVDVPLGLTSSCEDISFVVPVQAGTREIEIIYSDILMNHSHSYPQKIHLVKSIEAEGEKFSAILATDAKKCDLSFLKDEKKFHIDIEGRREATNIDEGYFSLTFPRDLLGGNYTVLVDGKPTSFIEDQFFTKNYTDIGVQSATQDDFTPIKASHLSFNYSRDATSIEIIGTTAIPEFDSSIIIMFTASLVGASLMLSRQLFWLQKK
jgi:hypothetical protein